MQPTSQYENIMDMHNNVTSQNIERTEDTDMSLEREDAPHEDVRNVNRNIGSLYQDLSERPVLVPVVYDRIRHVDM